MAFDQPTRNRLNSFVGQARALLTEEFTRQLQSDYGIDPGSGRVDDVAGIIHLDDRQRETARILRDTLHHYSAGKGDSKTRIAAIDRIVREQAFTVLNRLAALRMMEARGLLITSIAEGARSDGFQLYQQLAGVALGETDEAYVAYIFSLFDEFAVDLPVLFDRFSPQGRLFPSVRVLRQLLGLINDAEIAPLWAEDETIGWIYQYFNSKEERQQMRQASQAPRNSRELAVRNQFFTPRYVVEFLTDNTLGRIWYEMTKGETRLADECRYLVRRPAEVFLRDPDKPLANAPRHPWVRAVARGDFSRLPDDPSEGELHELSLVIDGYELAEKRGIGDVNELVKWADGEIARARATGIWPDSSLELWIILFRLQRYHGRATIIEPEMTENWRLAYRAFKASFDTRDLSQDELLRQPVYILHRPLKDPREIKMLDPACGSMHFGLYAFDLFETIYDEAWELGRLGDWAGEYRNKAAFMRDVPRLIIEHNIHGIDIDARAVQIAGLSLWLRAQRSWQAQGVPAADRPTVARSNVVVAEPMPGDEAELEAFLAAQFDDTAQDQIVAGLVQRVFEAMKLAGEAGSLLKIEEEIADDIAAAKEEWTARPKASQGSLFEQPQQASLAVDVPTISEEQFWDQVEEYIYAALEESATQAEQGKSYRRRLFAQDTARGFAFIDLCRQTYDVVLMNPPFGDTPSASRYYYQSHYPDSKNDLLAMFVEMGVFRSNVDARLGAIVARPALFLSSMEKWRKDVLLGVAPLQTMADLGENILDSAMVKAAAFVIQKDEYQQDLVPFFDVTSSIDKAVQLVRLCRTFDRTSTYWVSLDDLKAIPNSPIAYWTSEGIRRCFRQLSSLADSDITVKQGLGTTDDFRFVRTSWEIPIDFRSRSGRWYPYAKGGESQWFYGDVHLNVNWGEGGKEIYASTGIPYGGAGAPIRNPGYYGKGGLTYTSYTNKGFRPRLLPRGCIFTTAGMGIFAHNPLSLLALLNTTVVQELLSTITDGRKWEVGYVQSVPYPRISDQVNSVLSEIALKCWTRTRGSHTFDETSPTFQAPFVRPRESLVDTIQATNKYTDASIAIVSSLMREADSLALELYELSRDEITLHIGENSTDSTSPSTVDSVSIVMWLIGNNFGRWDVRHAIGDKEPSLLPDPFDPLPVCAPGMLQNAKGLPAAPEDVPADYPLRISWPGVLVDDDGHPEDIVNRVREALHIIWGEKADDIEAEACSLLGVDTLRDYFGNPNKFFDDHLSRYSKSRRAAPIYWPLTTTNGSYSLWLYYHRLDAGTLYQCVNDYVDPKLAAVQRQLNGLRNHNRDWEDERELERLTDLAVELETFRKDLLELARFWQPNLNDGVEVTAAPLRALFGHRQWRNRLEETWGKLQEGGYDWAHLAMSIWPGRVVPKCAEDRSLAIAHDIEKLFWVEADETWRSLRTPTEEETHQVEIRQVDERDRLRALFAELAAGEGRYLPAMQVWQSLADGEWDHRPLGLHLYPERAAVAAFDDATRVYPHLDQPEQKLLQKATLKNKQLLTRRLMERGTPELISAVAATLADEPAAFAELWRALESGKHDDLPLALELWPERVVGKALRDPDLAARHGLFDFFWYDEPGAGARRRQPIDREIAHEVERRGGDRL